MPLADQFRAFDAAQKYISQQMTPADVVSIMTYDGAAVRLRREFTNDRRLLLDSLRALSFGDDQDGDGIRDYQSMSTAFGQDEAAFRIFNTDRQLASLQTAVSLLAEWPERKTLLYFSSGVRLNGLDNNAQLRATTNAAIRANVTVNPLDARGLVSEAPLGDATRRSPGGLSMFTGTIAESATRGFQRSQDTLYALAKDTGGVALFDYNDLSTGIARAANQVTSYYLLAYYSTHTATDGRFRRVTVTLNGGVTGDLSYRRGYFADKTFAQFTAAERERQLEEALMVESPITQLGVAMEINYFRLNVAEVLRSGVGEDSGERTGAPAGASGGSHIR